MRAFALLLILANVCYFFWTHYIDVPELAPRATSQPASNRPPQLRLAREREPDAEASAAQQAANELSCISVGPFGSAEELQQLGKRLLDAGFAATPRSESGEIFAGYWVSLQGLATRADAEQTLMRLRAAGVTDAYVMPDDRSAEGSPNVLSLGLFSEQSRAEARREAIAKLGFEPRLQTRTRHGDTHWLDVTLQEPGQLIDPALLQPESGGIVRLETRACPETAAQATSASSSSSAQSAASSSKSSR